MQVILLSTSCDGGRRKVWICFECLALIMLMTREVKGMLRVKGTTLFELSAKEEYVCYEQLKKYFDQMYFAN